MAVSGIVAEFNPLHNGHKYLIDCAKKDGNSVICAISGNFVQRGDTAIVPKFTRAQMALEAGADVVVELPVPWSMSTAQSFAYGAIAQLAAFKIDSLYFGSESGNLSELLAVADILESEEYSDIIKNNIYKGETFAMLRSDAVNTILGYTSSVLDSPNDTLAVEYILASRRLGLKLSFHPVKRIGSSHNDEKAIGLFANATQIRNAIARNDVEFIKEHIPEECFELLLDAPKSNVAKLDTAIISRLKLLDKSDLASLPDISEGLENLLYNNIRTATDYSELLTGLKSKRYTLARIRRLVLSAFLGIDNRYMIEVPPYVRVLGFKKEKSNLIKNADSSRVVTSVAQIKELDDSSRNLFSLENTINEIYSLSLDQPNQFINECKEKIIIK